MPNYRTWVEISDRALQQNVQSLRSLLNPGTRFCAVVKANAYGHGLEQVARIASRAGVDAFGVDTIEDARFLRGLFPSALLIVLGYTLDERLSDALDVDAELTVYDPDTIVRLEELAAARAKTAHVHLKIETGTARQGVFIDDLEDILDLLRRCPHVELTGLSTHFANVEEAEDPAFANVQFHRFLDAQKRVSEAGFAPAHVHCACSAALILYPDTQGTLVRAGISLYGLWSSEEAELVARRHGIKAELTPALAWKSRIAQVKSYPVGSSIGYNRTEVLRRNSRVAVVPVGYFDGYDRKLSSAAEVLVGGYRCKVLGRVCMNMMMVDVSDVPKIEREQEVVLIGRMGRHEISANELAKKVGTINYEIVTRINPSLPRLVV